MIASIASSSHRACSTHTVSATLRDPPTPWRAAAAAAAAVAALLSQRRGRRFETRGPGCEYTYFTPTRADADIGGQLDVPTLNLIGTRDEFFGPPERDGWAGSIASKIAADGTDGTGSGWGDADLTGNGYSAFLRQGLKTALVATFVGADHDVTIDADNAVRDVLLSFLAAPLRCTELLDQWGETVLTARLELAARPPLVWPMLSSAHPLLAPRWRQAYLMANTRIMRRCAAHASSPRVCATKGGRSFDESGAVSGATDYRDGCSLLWVQLEQNHGIPPTVPYGEYKLLASRWAHSQRACFASTAAEVITHLRANSGGKGRARGGDAAIRRMHADPNHKQAAPADDSTPCIDRKPRERKQRRPRHAVQAIIQI